MLDFLDGGRKPAADDAVEADDIVTEAKELFDRAAEAESEDRVAFVEDIRFARLGEQWPEKMKKQREDDGRPCLVINQLPAFIRQVVNDSRQNKPAIKVSPADSIADPATANVLAGLIRNIEQASSADVAYDTAIDYAVSGGRGYFRVAVEYSHDDTFDRDIVIKRVENPLAVYGDPDGVEADSSDWNFAFVTQMLTGDEFKGKYKGASKVDWENTDGYKALQAPWRDGDDVLVAEFWRRSEQQREIVLLSDGKVIAAENYEQFRFMYEPQGISVSNSRTVLGYKLKHYIMSGAEVLEENDWPGKYIPIIPVYGEEINLEGKRCFRSMIRDAKDAQAMHNFWRTASTELVALAPRVPFIGVEGVFDGEDRDKWAKINTKSFPYVSYASPQGQPAPQRQPLDSGAAVGAMTEALKATDDMKAILGMYNASLGQKSNETSGRAIMARQREGDVGSFHFIDNLARSIRHSARVIIDLIPHVYSGERMIRVLGQDGAVEIEKLGKLSAEEQQGLNQEQPAENPEEQKAEEAAGKQAEAIKRVYDLGLGKYDVSVSTGPSFTTRREETAQQMIEFVQAFPSATPVIGDLLVKALDWPQAEEIAARLKAMMPAQAQGGLPPEVEAQMQEGQQMIDQLQQELQKVQSEHEQMKSDRTVEQGRIEIDGEKMAQDAQLAAEQAARDHEAAQAKLAFDRQKAADDAELAKLKMRFEIGKLDVEQYKAETDRMVALAAAQREEAAGAEAASQQPMEPAAPPATPEDIAGAMAQAISSMPPPVVNITMPPPTRIKRTAVRDEGGVLTHSIDEPIMDEAG